jgi:hypothetical protein
MAQGEEEAKKAKRAKMAKTLEFFDIFALFDIFASSLPSFERSYISRCITILTSCNFFFSPPSAINRIIPSRSIMTCAGSLLTS